MDIQELRKQINDIDAQLVKLFEARMNVALEIAKYKQETGMPVFDPVREREVLDRQAASVAADLTTYVKLLYHTLFDVSRSYQRRFLATKAEISGQGETDPDANRVCLTLRIPDRPGALYSIIGRFAVLGLNLIRLECSVTANDDVEICCELEASPKEEAVLQLLSELNTGDETFAYLGSYCKI